MREEGEDELAGYPLLQDKCTFPISVYRAIYMAASLPRSKRGLYTLQGGTIGKWWQVIYPTCLGMGLVESTPNPCTFERIISQADHLQSVSGFMYCTIMPAF